MRILSHRGWWRTPAEHNTPGSFARSFEAGYGTETDLRDRLGQLVVSHDPATTSSPFVDELFALHAKLAPATPLALNIKADGLCPLLRAALERTPVADFFCFDMSVPETRRYAAAGLPYFTRQSDCEPEPVLLARAAGVWLDTFERDWLTPDVVARHLDAGRRVCLVSPELHRRDPLPFWREIRDYPGISTGEFLLCTDNPQEAERFFSLP